jgi:methionyl-tRNA formyltransferase
MEIALFCASQRGLKFLEALGDLCPDDVIDVYTFREDPWEAPFYDDIRSAADERGYRCREIKGLSRKQWEEISRDISVDLLFTVGWRYLLPESVYSQSRMASIGFHDSLLPAYRGFAPTNWAIINGEHQTGATMFLLSEGTDDGPIVDQEVVGIGPSEAIASVADNVTKAYLTLLARNMPSLRDGTFVARPQDESAASLTCKRVPEDGEIDWNRSAMDIHNLVRATSRPWPGAYTFHDGRRLYIWSARPSDGPHLVGSIPGRVADMSRRPEVGIATGDGVLMLGEVEYEGESPIPAEKAIRGITSTLGRRRE